MEKNGAISKDTPCDKPDCCRKSGGEKLAQMAFNFPEDEKTADRLDGGLMKDVVDAVNKATKQ